MRTIAWITVAIMIIGIIFSALNNMMNWGVWFLVIFTLVLIKNLTAKEKHKE